MKDVRLSILTIVLCLYSLLLCIGELHQYGLPKHIFVVLFSMCALSGVIMVQVAWLVEWVKKYRKNKRNRGEDT